MSATYMSQLRNLALSTAATKRVQVKPATLRDVSYVMANLRPADEVEVLCQFPSGVKRHELAYMLLHSMEAWAVHIDGQPVAAFGAAYMTEVAASAWAIGTKRMKRAIPAITKHFRTDIGPRLGDAGYRMLEARSHAEHHEAHRWMVATGAVQADQPYIYGKNGELFITFRWT